MWSTGSRRAGFISVTHGLSSCGTQAQQLWHTGLVAPQHVGSSRTRDRARVPCIGRWILNHCTTREVHIFLILFFFFFFNKDELEMQQEEENLPYEEEIYKDSTTFLKGTQSLFIYLFIFGCVGSSFLCEGFL